MTKLSVIILCKTKADATDAADSATFADEVLVKDEGEITDFALARNQALSEVKGEWVMFLDSDEKITPKLADEVRKAIDSPLFVGYYLRRLDRFLGKDLRHGENASVRLLRLAKRNAGTFSRPVHEVWNVEGRVGELENPLLHYPHPTISSFLDKINTYSSVEAQHRFQAGVRATLFNVLLYPPMKFLQNYLIRWGILDGIPGAIMAVMMSFHSFQNWTKLYLMQKGITHSHGN